MHITVSAALKHRRARIADTQPTTKSPTAPTTAPTSPAATPGVYDSDACFSQPCLNGGACALPTPVSSNLYTSYLCICADSDNIPGKDWFGRECQDTCDACASMPCPQDTNGQYQDCNCKQDPTSQQVSFTCTHSACPSQPCKNGGKCLEDGSGSFVCQCDPNSGMGGPTCAGEASAPAPL